MSTETTQELVGQTVATPFVGSADTENTGAQYAIAEPARRDAGACRASTPASSRPSGCGRPARRRRSSRRSRSIDELAVAAGMDPIAFRQGERDRRPLGRRARRGREGGEVDSRASPHSQQQTGTIVTGRGVAIGGFSGTLTAIVAEIEVNTKTGKIIAKHLYGAQDAGLAVNPGLVENQIEGCLIQGCSRALLEEVKFSKIERDEPRLGELPGAPVQGRAERDADRRPAHGPAVERIGRADDGAACRAAIANAFFDATGVRLRQYPMTPAVVRAALKTKA